MLNISFYFFYFTEITYFGTAFPTLVARIVKRLLVHGYSVRIIDCEAYSVYPSPLSPESHLGREVAFLTESISQPHDMSGTSSTNRIVVSPTETEQWIPDGIGTPEELGKRGSERTFELGAADGPVPPSGCGSKPYM
ncbi:hypothetical protein Bca52824_042462 [Brassica carinata]|uniref:Uncharacterized protein n=1 Tax=Brassica carinata TaxID=52824 RepID=A0A8X7RUT8_BRACI|nr:hypothetical protein Bca52824_042462 [Brassica carinata]